MREWCQHGYGGSRPGHFWLRIKDGNPKAFDLYRRHYSAKKNPRPKIRQFVGPGEKEVLISRDGLALFAWRKFIDDSGQRGVNCAVFRNESEALSSDMIREAMEFAWARWPGERLYTYVNPEEVRSINPGCCFKSAGWEKCGETGRGYHILEAFPPHLAITNYEKMNPESLSDQIVSEMKHLAGIVLDESSRLKTGGGKQKWALIKSCRGIEYKLSCTATPAPNDVMEFASQASFLEKMRSEGEILWTFFRRDEKTHRWTVKPHAREAFFRFMADWSIYLRDPRRYGWRLDMPEIPRPVIEVHEIECTPEQRQLVAECTAARDGQLHLFAAERSTSAIQRGRLSQVAKGFRYLKGEKGAYRRVPSHKPAFCADLIRSEVAAGHQVIVWTVFDAEAELLAAELRDSPLAVLTGKTKEKERLATLDKFRKGDVPVLVSRATMLGYGMNLQCCTSMIFSGWNDSYEAYYQAIRRAYRFGQKQALRVHVPCIHELENDMLENVFRKQADHEAAIREMEDNYITARKELEGR